MQLGIDKMFITGAAGWLGQSLVNALVRGLPDVPAFSTPFEGSLIRVMDLSGSRSGSLKDYAGKVEILDGDVRDPEDCKRLCAAAEGGTLVHLVGIIHPKAVKELYEINVEGTRRVMEAAIGAGVKRIIVLSSNSPCGCNPSADHRFDESAPYRPYMHYGRSKMKMEQEVRRVQEEGRIETVVIRAAWFYGPFQPPRQTLFFRMIRDGGAPIVGGGNNLRSMSYVDNLAQGILLSCAKREAVGQTYWIADERPYTTNEIVDTVERLLETEFGQTCKHKRLRLPGLASEVAYVVDYVLQSMGLYHQKIHVLSEMNKHIACSVEKAKRDLGYRPAVALEEGMRRSLAWCFKHQGGIDSAS